MDVGISRERGAKEIKSVGTDMVKHMLSELTEWSVTYDRGMCGKRF
jgi:hypothetical protein